MKKLFTIISILLCIPFTVFAAPPVVNGTVGSGFNTPRASSLTFAHTINASLTNSLLVVTCANNDSKASNTGLAATWNGGAMTLGTSTGIVANSSSMWQGMWYLANPTSGTHNVVVSNTLAGGSRFYCGAYTLTGAAQTNPLDISSTTGSTVLAKGSTTTMTTLSANTIVIDTVFTQAQTTNQAWNADPSQTQAWFIQGNTNQEPSNGSYKTQATAASVTMADNLSTSTAAITQLIVAILPAPAGFDFGQWFPF